VIDHAVAELKKDPVYVDPSAEKRISRADEQRLEQEIDNADGGQIYVVVLPGSAGNDPAGVVRTIHNRLHRDGTYAGVIGNHLLALSSTLPSGEAGRLATEAIDAPQRGRDADADRLRPPRLRREQRQWHG